MKKFIAFLAVLLSFGAVFLFGREYLVSVYANITLAADRIKSSVSDARMLTEENEELARMYENEVLKANNYLLLREENRNLRNLLSLREKTEGESVAAEIISYTNGTGFEYMIADKGLNDGINVGMCVISEGGFVGIVSQCGKDWCGIKTLYSEDVKLSVTSRMNGKTYLLSGGDLSLGFVSSDDDMESGGLVVSSGLSANIPKGLKVGRISSVSESDGAEQKVSVKPIVDYENISYVLVLIS